MSLLTAGLGACCLVALGLLFSSLRAWFRRHSWLSALCTVVSALASGSAIAVTGYSWWYHHRRQPVALTEELFATVEHQRIVRTSPRALVINVLRVPLGDPRIELLVTPPTPTSGHEQKARTTTEFAEEFQVQLAINANFFSPWSGSYLWPVPERGGEVDVLGLAVSRGERYGRPHDAYTSLVFTKEKHARLGEPGDDTITGVSGRPVLVKDGVVKTLRSRHLEPRTALCVTAERMLVMVTVDGRQPRYSEGMGLGELAELMLELQCHNALNLDGGGSTTMVVRSKESGTKILNTPIHRRIPPGQERPIANHFGIFVR